MGPLRNYLPNFSNSVYYKQQRYLWACGKELSDRKQNHPKDRRPPWSNNHGPAMQGMNGARDSPVFLIWSIPPQSWTLRKWSRRSISRRALPRLDSGRIDSTAIRNPKRKQSDGQSDWIGEWAKQPDPDVAVDELESRWRTSNNSQRSLPEMQSSTPANQSDATRRIAIALTRQSENYSEKNNPQIKESTENTRCDQPSNLILYDKDQADDSRDLSRSFTASQTNR
jgi:hypothetical protein